MPGWYIGYNGVREKEAGELRKQNAGKQGMKQARNQGIRGLEAAFGCRELMRQ